MHKRIKITAIVCILAFSTHQQVHALPFIPAFLYFGLPVAAVDASLIAHATVGAALWWYNKNGGAKSTTPAGDIKSQGTVQWVDLVDGKPATFQADTNNKVNHEDLKNGVNANPTKYPKLKDAFLKPGYYPDSSKDSSEGLIYNVPGQGYHKLLTRSYTIGTGCRTTSNTVTVSGSYITHTIKQHYDTDCYNSDWSCILTYGLTVEPPPPTSTRTPAEFAAQMYEPSTGLFKDIYKGEIDDFITSNPNIVHYEDDSGNSAVALVPSTALTSAQAASAAASQAASAARSGASSSSYSNYSAISVQYGSGSPEAQAAYANYQRDVAEREQAAADEAEAAAAASAVPTNAYDSTVENPEKKSIATLLGDFASNSPLAGMIETFQVQTSGASPVVILGNAWGTELKIDLTRWESFLATCGQMLLILTHGYAVLVVIRRW